MGFVRPEVWALEREISELERSSMCFQFLFYARDMRLREGKELAQGQTAK